MANEYVAPAYKADGFHCPHCEIYAHQIWRYRIIAHEQYDSPWVISGFAVSKCQRCHEYTFWLHGNILYPDRGSAPVPNPDMASDARADYDEAASVVARSPRSAAALLRQSIQKVCIHLGEGGKSLNDAIGELVKKGLRPQIQKALDVVRVVGNNAVHPGQLDLKDDRATCTALFDLVNITVDDRISQPKEVDALFDGLPQDAKEQITRRDAESVGST